MKKTILTLTFLLIVTRTFAQTVSYPDVDSKGENDIYIQQVSTTEYYTQIDFVYKNTKKEGQYIYLNSPGHEDAYYIKANDQVYQLLSTQNIGNATGVTAAMPGELVEFSARFERLPSYISQFDLIEGKSGTWDFYGVKLKKEETTNSSAKKFRVDYNYVAAYDTKNKTWGEWKVGDNTFVFNINDKGDIAHFKANGENAIYKKLSGVEEGYTEKGNYHYQIIKALDDDGDIFSLQLFDDPSIGLKMIWGTFMVQFAKL